MSLSCRPSTRALVALALILMLVALACYGWQRWRHWAPARQTYPVQGLALSAAQGEINWGSLRAQNPDFAYIRAVTGLTGRDAAFSRNWSAAKAMGMRYGAEIMFDPCGRASDQATIFLTTVPRDAAALPPAIRLDAIPACIPAPGQDKVVSELNTLINLVEAHMGKPALLHVSAKAEALYGISTRINRTLWLDRNWLAPDYASHRWVMWSANSARHLRGVDAPVEWVVVAD